MFDHRVYRYLSESASTFAFGQLPKGQLIERPKEMLSQQLQYVLIPLQGNALQSVEEHLAGHHGNDYGVPPSDINGPCAIAGMFGCAPAFSDDDYNREGLVHDGPPVVFSRKQQFN